MSITSIIFSGLLILQIITMNMLFSDYARDRFNSFEEKRLQVAVNYAVDAASKEMKDVSANLGQDYVSIAKLNVDPVVAMDTFATILCKNYDVPLSSTTQQSILLEYCPVFVVAAYDGYYVADRQVINSSGVPNLIFGTKMPYSDVVIKDDGTTSYYSYNLSLTDALRIDENGAVYKDFNPPLTREEQKALINGRLSDALNTQLLKYADQPRGEFYIPSSFTTVKSTNPIDYTTVLVYIDNFDLPNYGLDLQCFGVGGSEIRQKQVVVGFELTVNGKIEKYYTYSEYLPNDVIPLETFDSQEDAAKAGYYYYIY